MFGLNKKENKKEDTAKENVPEAEEVKLSQTDENLTYLNPNYLKGFLVGRAVSTGEIITLERKAFSKDKDKPSLFKQFFDMDFGEFFPEISDIKLVVLDTKPKGKVRITSNTKINYSDISLNEDGIPNRKIIKVKFLPDLKDLTEVTDISEIKKITNIEGLIGRFEDDKQVVYFTKGYFYRKKKNKG